MKLITSKFWLLILAAIPLGMVAGQFRMFESTSDDSVDCWNGSEWVGAEDSVSHDSAFYESSQGWSRRYETQNVYPVEAAKYESRRTETAQAQFQSHGFQGSNLAQPAVSNLSSSRSATALGSAEQPSLRSSNFQNSDASAANAAQTWAQQAANIEAASGQLSNHPIPSYSENTVRPVIPVANHTAVDTPSTQPPSLHLTAPAQDSMLPALPTNSSAAQALNTVVGQTFTDSTGQTRIVLPDLNAGSANTNVVGSPVASPPNPGKHPKLKPTSTVEGDDKSITLRLNNEDLRAVLEMISMESGLSILPSESVQGFVTANISNVTVMDALEAILFNAGFKMQQRDGFIFVGTPADFDRMEQISLPVETRVIRPCFVSAQELESLVKPLLTSIGTLNVTTAATQGLAQSSGTSSGATLGGSSQGSSGGAGAATNGNYTGSDILVIRDVPTALLRVEELINEIDVPPLQVAIEALILSVKLDDKHRLGVNLELLKGDGVRVVSGNLPGTLDTLETGQGLLSMGFLEANVGSFIAALDDIGETNVIAAPHVLALNKMSAQILIGEQIGFANTTVTQTAATQSIQFLDVGTQLQLRPFVNEEGLIRLEIHPEVSQGTVRSVGDLALPEKTVTQVTTNVMCRDNETIIIGGLIREEVDDVHRGVPLFGKMPILGPMFRSRNRNTSREELLVLLTPHVIRDPADAIPDGRVVNNFVDRRASILISEKKNWALRKQEAQRYVSLARNAWVSGNPSACQRYSSIAIELDPNCAELLAFAPDTFVETNQVISVEPEATPELAPEQLQWAPNIEVRDPEQLHLQAPPADRPSVVPYSGSQLNSDASNRATSSAKAEDAKQFLDFLKTKSPTDAAQSSARTATGTPSSTVGKPFGANR